MRGDVWTRKEYEEVLNEVLPDLWMFVRRNARVISPVDQVAALTGLSRRALDVLLAVHYLLDPRTEKFLKAVSNIMQRLRRSALPCREEASGIIRGRIDWGATIRSRVSSGWDWSRYTVVRGVRNFDLHENRVLKFLLKHIAHLADGIVRGTSEWQSAAFELVGTGTHVSWASAVEHYGAVARAFLRTAYLREVSDLPYLTDIDVDRLRGVRGYWYRAVEEAAAHYLEATQESRDYIEAALRQRVLEPLSRDDLYELWVLFKSLRVLRETGWRQRRVGLIGASKGFLASYERSGARLAVYYQRVPKQLNEVSKYRGLMEQYGLGQAVRRPDIILKVECGETKYIIIEVKRSRNRGYIADGAYKLIGYLSDFGDALRNSVRGILVVWDGVNYKTEFAGDRIVLTSYKSYDVALRDVLAKIYGNGDGLQSDTSCA